MHQFISMPHMGDRALFQGLAAALRKLSSKYQIPWISSIPLPGTTLMTAAAAEVIFLIINVSSLSRELKLLTALLHISQ